MMRVLSFRVIIIAIGFALTAGKAHALVQASTDLSLLGGSKNLDLKLKQRVYFGGKGFSLGPSLLLERPQQDIIDVVAGAGAQFGDRFFVAFDVGFFLRRYIGFRGIETGRGFAIIPSFGIRFKMLRVSLPFVVKRTASGLDPSWSFNVVPFVGVQW